MDELGADTTLYLILMLTLWCGFSTGDVTHGIGRQKRRGGRVEYKINS